MALRDVVSYLISAQDDTRAATESAKRNLAGLRNEFASVQSSLAAIGRAGGALISLAAVKAGTAAIIETRVEMERMRNTLSQGVGAQNVASELLFVRKAANDFGLSLTDVSASYARFAAASRGTVLEGQQTRDVFLGISTAATVLGLSSDQMNGALTAVQQMISKGKVSAEELRGQLGERLPGAFQIAARAMGVTTSELDRMMAAGDLLTEDFLPKFSNQLRTEFSGALGTAGDSAAATINRLTTAWDGLKQTFAVSPIGDAVFAGIRLLTKDLEHLANVTNAQALGVGSSSLFGFTEADIALMRGLRTNPAELGEGRLSRKEGVPEVLTPDEMNRRGRNADREADNNLTREAIARWTKLNEKYRTAAERQADIVAEIRAVGVEAGRSEPIIRKLIEAATEKKGRKPRDEQPGIDREKLQAEISQTRSALKSIETIYAGHQQELEANRSAGLISEETYYEQIRFYLAKIAQARTVALETDSDSLRAAGGTARERIDRERQIAENVAEVRDIMNAASSADTVLQIQQTASGKKRTAAWNEARIAAESYLNAATQAQERELEGIGKGGNERERLSGRSQIDDKYEGQRQQLESEKRTGAFKNMPGEYERQLGLIAEFQGKALAGWEKHYAARRALDQDAALGASEGLANYLAEAGNTFQQTEDLVGGSLRSVEDAFVELARTGKVNFRSLIDDMLAQLARIAAQQLLVNIIGSVSGNSRLGGGWTAGGAGWGSQNMSTGTNRVPYDGFRATLHKDEAVVPAKYNPAVGGMGGGSTTIVQNFNISGGGDGNDPQRLAAMVGDVAMARADEARRRRPGG